jgi:creatinine amidohydrolase
LARGEIHQLAHLTWTEVRGLLERAPGTLALIPVGAVEAHGPHLPLGTDLVIAEGVARRAGQALAGQGRSVVVVPALAYSVTDYAGEFAGTVGIGAEVARAHVGAVLAGLGRAGLERAVLVNAHLEPAHAQVLRAAAAERNAGCETTRVVVADPLERRFGKTLTDEYKRGECHAGSYETSLVLAERPELVRELRAQLPRVPIDLAQAMKDGKRTFGEAGADQAYFGDPAAATAAEGEWIYARLTAAVITVVSEAWPAT